jgi:Trk-type K+ transport system membrane component
MIDFNAAQLTWIVLGACSMGGTGYLTMDSKMQALDKKIEINSVQLAAVTANLEDVKKLMVRIDDKLDRKK